MWQKGQGADLIYTAYLGCLMVMDLILAVFDIFLASGLISVNKW